MLRLEELRTLGHLATELGLIFLANELGQLFLERLFKGLTAQFLEIGILRLQKLKEFVFKGFDPVECSLDLLLCLRRIAVLLLPLVDRG
jgi:hypothetical protein